MIPRSKFGDCSRCGATDTNVVKIRKELFCLACNRVVKTKQYEAKSREKTKVRGLVREQARSENYFQAEIAAIKNDLDYVVRRMVKLMAVDNRGWGNCYICDNPVHIEKGQAMHFIKRGETALRYDYRRNIRYGCKTCNEFKGGNLDEYEKRLNEEQSGLPEQLKEEAREVYKWSREELKQLLLSLRPKLQILEQKLKNNQQSI